MLKMRIGDKIILRRNGTNMIWETSKKKKVKVGQEFDPLAGVKVFGCNGKPAEVTVINERSK